MADHALGRFEGQAFDDQVVIDRLCSRYEGALRAGEDPSLEEYLQNAHVSDPACLLTELVVIDRAYRGERVSRDDYVARFPDFAAAIDEAFGVVVRSTASVPPRPGVITPPTIEGYEILGELGRGGMGVVFKARHLRLKRLVALKLILQGDFASEKHRARFLIETEMLGRLRHPNVVQVFEAGQQDGRPFLALEFIEGGTLAQRLASAGPAAPREAAALVRDLARGVHHAHLQGVIHRDLKPANVLLSSDGTAKVTDFGVACQPGGNEMSQTGQLIGTPGYMPPEQARGERESLGPRADVYSLGAVLYEALTGQAPFRAATPLETVRRVLNDEPTPPARLRPGLDPDLSTICLKCLSKEPAGRYASADALADDLTRWLGGEPIAARPAGAAERVWKWARRKPTQAGLLAVSVLFLLAVVCFPTVAAWRLSYEQERTLQAEKQRRLALVKSLHTAAPESVPFLVEELALAPELVLPLLREQLADVKTRFRAAVALTLLGEDQTDQLVAAIPTTSPAESTNLARAFHASRSPGLADELHRRGTAAAELTWRVRYAILLLDLGDARLARSLLAAADPGARSTLFEEIPAWHGTLAALPAVLESADEDLRSALCAALGRVDPARLDPNVHQALADVLARLFQTAADGGTHAAAEWALCRWNVALPPIPKAAGDRRWFVNRVGMTMMRIPPGFAKRNGDVKMLPRPYYIADREVPIRLYLEMKADKAVRLRERGLDPDPDLRPDQPLPLGRITFAAPFCNWLSLREGRQECYFLGPKGQGGWQCNPRKNGYRLPTDAEWDHAHRAGSPARFFFGNDARWLPLYGHVAYHTTAPCGSKLPNRWGLFDVVGNLWEATSEPGPNRPIEGGYERTIVMRGGDYRSGSNDYLAASRHEGSDRGKTVGFRVVCGSAPHTQEPTSSPDDGLASIALLVRIAGDDVDLIKERANLHGRYGQWREAAADYRRLAGWSPRDLDIQSTYAALLAWAGDRAGYRAARRHVLDLYGRTFNPVEAERAAKACLLAEGDDLDTVMRMLDMALSTHGHDWVKPYAKLAQGMAEYRRGDFKAALGSLEGCQDAGRTRIKNEQCHVLRGFFLAMAQHRLGRYDEAARTFEQYQADRARLAKTQATSSDPWQDGVRSAIAEAEAREVLKNRPR